MIGSPSISTRRSISDRPCGTAILTSQTGKPFSALRPTSLPLAKPATINPPSMAGVLVPRKVSTGIERSCTHNSSPLSMSSAETVPSTVCTITLSMSTWGTENTSLLTSAFHNKLPSSALRASTSALLVPNRIMPPPAPGPAEMATSVLTCQFFLPVSAFNDTTRPL